MIFLSPDISLANIMRKPALVAGSSILLLPPVFQFCLNWKFRQKTVLSSSSV